MMDLKRGRTSFVSCGLWVAAMICAPLMLAGCCCVIPRGDSWIVPDATTRIADPKLMGGAVEISFHLEPAGTSATMIAEILQGATVVNQVWTGAVIGGAPATSIHWDGRNSAGQFVDTGDYRIRLRGVVGPPSPVDLPLSVVRLGITEMEAQESAAGNDEWQMVYFMKGASYGFYATPAIHEYLSTAESGEVSDLDLDNGNPRPVPAVHNATDSPVLEAGSYEDDSYNYPVCYVMGAQPRFEVTLGDSATSASGGLMPVGYPVPGFDIRLQARLGGQPLGATGPIVPAGKAILDGPTLPSMVTRVDLALEMVWQYRAQNAASWTDVPGATTIPFRVYTVVGRPAFADGAAGTQYAGPWVEVAEYWHQWRQSLGISTNSEAACVENHVKGFFGQNAGIPTAIEGMLYDSPPGGDGGGTRYHNWVTWNMGLSALLNSHDNGIYFNCSDNMGATSTMLAMMGVRNIRAVYLGNMSLNAIWGIGTSGYTTDLWGPGSHGFSYHHIVTRHWGSHVIDSCMLLDEDGNPGSTPGVPGWNHDRPWDGPSGYDVLSATNPVSRTIQDLPGLQ